MDVKKVGEKIYSRTGESCAIGDNTEKSLSGQFPAVFHGLTDCYKNCVDVCCNILVHSVDMRFDEWGEMG